MSKMDKKPTIKDVAKKSKVSVATVSRVLNHLDGYSEETRAKVMKVVTEIGYRRNAIARNLKINKSHTVGVLVPKIDTLFYVEILNGIEDTARKNNYSIVICNTGDFGSRTQEYLNVLLESQADGVIACSLSPEKGYDKQIIESNFPCIFVSTLSHKYPIPYVKVDDYQAAYAATSYLIKMGHTKIAMLAGTKDDLIAGIPRVRGFKDALKEHKLKINENLIKYGDFSYNDGISTMEKLLEEKDEYTAVFAACDDIAFGAMTAAYKKGIKIPDDLSIIGYDNTKFAKMSNPSLTTVAQPLYKMGQKAFEMIYRSINSGKKTESIVLPFEIVERETVKKIN